MAVTTVLTGAKGGEPSPVKLPLISLLAFCGNNIIIADATCHSSASELLTYIPRHGYGYVIGILSAGRLLVHISKVGIAACIPAIDK